MVFKNKAVSITTVTNEADKPGTKEVNINGMVGRMNVKMDAAGIREMKRMYPYVYWTVHHLTS